MNTILLIMSVSLLIVILVLSAVMFTYMIVRNNQQKSGTEKEFTKDEAMLYVMHFVYLSIYKMYESEDLLDFKSFAQSVETNMGVLMSNQTEYNECLAKMKEHINEQ